MALKNRAARRTLFACAMMTLASSPAAALAQSSYFSATGTFTAPTGASQRFVVAFDPTPAETTFRTLSWSGGVNAAGNTIPGNGIDSFLEFSDGLDFEYTNDDLGPGTRDSLITIPPGEATDGTLTLSNSPAASGLHWALDMTRNGGLLVRRFGATNSVVSSVAWGGSSPGISRLRLGIPTSLVTTGPVTGNSGSSFELVTGGRLQVGSNFTFMGVGTMTAGTLSVNNTESINGSMHQSGGINSAGTLYVGEIGQDGTYRLSGGTLNTFTADVGRFANGTFIQDGGSVAFVNTLTLAESESVTGRYQLNDGTVSAGWLEAGFSGNGVFSQTGGLASFSNALIGRATAATGRYDLSIGTLQTALMIVGQHGPGTFTHNSGHHAAGSMILGETTFGDGTYVQDGGPVTASGDIKVGHGGNGRIIHSGGSILANGNILLGSNSGSGTYTMNGGTLVAGVLKPGFNGAGTFIHSGGHVNPGEIAIGEGTGSVGRYALSGTGSIVTTNAYVAVAGDGRMTQTGGTMDVTGWFTMIGRDAGSMGVYEQSSGFHQTKDLYLGHSPGSHGIYELFGGVVIPTFNTFVGHEGTGTFLQSGGLHNPTMLAVGWNPTSSGFYELSGGTLQVQNTMTVMPTGSVSYSGGRLDVGTLDIRGGARVLLSTGGDKVVRASTLNMFGNGRLDLSDNAAIIDYSGTSPLPTVRNLIRLGYGGAGSWNGAGILSSTAAANPGYGLGYAEASAIFTNFPAQFEGQLVDDTSVLIRYTRYGDADLNHVVNLNDFNRLASNFGLSSGAVWSQGDFNYDGIVNLADFNRLAANFGLSAAGPDVTPGDWAALAAAVPEPAAPGAALVAMFGLSRRRR